MVEAQDLWNWIPVELRKAPLGDFVRLTNRKAFKGDYITLIRPGFLWYMDFHEFFFLNCKILWSLWRRAQ